MSNVLQISGYNIALCYGRQTTSTFAVAYVLSYPTGHGVFDTVTPCLIESRQKQKQRISSNESIPVSAGSDFTVSSLRPDDFIGWGSGLRAGYVIGQKGSNRKG